MPPIRRATVESAVEEGLMLAEYACRLKLRNLIVIEALTSESSYDPRNHLAGAKSVLSQLITESEHAADRLSWEITEVEGLRGRAEHAHDYQSADERNLQHRSDVAVALAHKLAERRDDEAYLLDLIERARVDAWSDVSRALQESLDRSTIIVDDDYERARGERVSELLGDLAALERQQS
ncbi:hypothetical protein [Homoserinimonas hongtaonis]|nr:hypothetical protein [Salinibacterium hongtaonis]